MTYALELHRSGPARRRGAHDRPDWAAPAPPPREAAAADATASDDEARPAPAFRRLVVFGSFDATAGLPAT